MNKPIGGRGRKAPYQSTHVRVPIPIKPEIDRMIARFHQGEEQLEENPLTSKENAIVIAQGILIQKKSARIAMSKLLTALYGEKIEL